MATAAGHHVNDCFQAIRVFIYLFIFSNNDLILTVHEDGPNNESYQHTISP